MGMITLTFQDGLKEENFLASVELLPWCYFPRGNLLELKAVNIFMAPVTSCLWEIFKISVLSVSILCQKNVRRK